MFFYVPLYFGRKKKQETFILWIEEGKEVSTFSVQFGHFQSQQ